MLAMSDDREPLEPHLPGKPTAVLLGVALAILLAAVLYAGYAVFDRFTGWMRARADINAAIIVAEDHGYRLGYHAGGVAAMQRKCRRP